MENISPVQHAFLPKHGVHSLCHQLENTLKQNLSKGKLSVVLSEDIEKAFNRVVLIFILDELLKIDGHFSQLQSLDNRVP